jgi:hypothetical protein
MNLALNINTNAGAGQYWITKNGNGLLYSNLIAGFPTPWGQTIVWDDALYSGNFALYNQQAWGQTIVWGENTTWSSTIAWETDITALWTTISSQTIVWDLVDALTIVWEAL